MTNIYNQLLNKEVKISIIGLGYVGLPIAVAFSKKLDVVGFDVNEQKIELYKNGVDPTNEVGSETLATCNVNFTSDQANLKEARFHIVAVPTPIKDDNTPDLTPLEKASKVLGKNLIKGSIVVYESTVFPGVTEEICVPILEKESGLKCGADFKVGYSPERINPGDKVHVLESIIKVVSGMDLESLDTISKVYELVVSAGVYRAESIKVAEAAKVIENSQRDINIAFMNELSIIFNKMGINTFDVLRAAGTKWNFLDFTPGLVGGHCIGVDPYYLTYKSEQLGYTSQIILSGRKVNDSMGKYIAENIVKKLIKVEKNVKNARVAIFGFTFKENCPDTRNTKVIDIINELNEYGIVPMVVDPLANESEVFDEYDLKLTELEEIKDVDALVFAVAHREFLNINVKEFDSYFKNEKNNHKIIIDVKNLFSQTDIREKGYEYWSL